VGAVCRRPLEEPWPFGEEAGVRHRELAAHKADREPLLAPLGERCLLSL